MRILQITQHYLPVCGGVETVVHETSRRLVRDGYDVTVICEREPGTARDEIIDGVKVHRVLGFQLAKMNYDEVRVAPEMLLELKRNNVDVVHFQGCGHFLLWVSLFTNKPTVITTHSDLPKGSMFWGELRSIPIRRCARIIAITEMEKQNLILRGTREDRIFVIPNGVTLPPPEVPRIDLGNAIFCLGRLDTYIKGQDILIQAMPKVISQVKDARLCLAGTGKDMMTLKRISRSLRIENSVTFLGEVSDYTKEVYLKNSSVFCLPSRIEAFGVVFLEAMAFGLPIVATGVGGIPEVIGEAGLLVEKNDPNALSDALISVLSDRDLSEKLRKKSLERVRLFDWDKIVKEYENLYEGLAR